MCAGVSVCSDVSHLECSKECARCDSACTGRCLPALAQYPSAMLRRPHSYNGHNYLLGTKIRKNVMSTVCSNHRLSSEVPVINKALFIGWYRIAVTLLAKCA